MVFFNPPLVLHCFFPPCVLSGSVGQTHLLNNFTTVLYFKAGREAEQSFLFAGSPFLSFDPSDWEPSTFLVEIWGAVCMVFLLWLRSASVSLSTYWVKIIPSFSLEGFLFFGFKTLFWLSSSVTWVKVSHCVFFHTSPSPHVCWTGFMLLISSVSYSLDSYSHKEDASAFPGKRALISFLSWFDYCDQLIKEAQKVWMFLLFIDSLKM